MGKLFLKLWLLLLLTSFTSFHIQRFVFDWSWNAASVNNSDERFRRTYVMIEEVLAPFPKSEWPARFARLQERVGSPETFLGPLRLLNLDELAKEGELSAEEMEKVRGQNHVSRDTKDGNGYLIYRSILETDMVVVLKAPFAKRQPMLIFGLFSSTQFAWLVESSMYALVIFLWLRLFRRDMLTLEKAAGRVGEGYFDFQIDMRKGAALYPLADSLNKMKDRIAALLGSHKNLTNAISHEFRTPITRLRFRHELAIEAKTMSEKNEQLRNMDSAIDQLDDLSTELLEYARLDRETPALDVAPIDAVTWLDGLADEAREVGTSEHRDVTVAIMAEIDNVDGDYRYLSRAVANLLRNAVHYCKARVELRIERVNGKFALHVDDDGPGIPATEREHLFEPFTRLDKSRDRQSGGFGIGLAIVRQIARWHGGTATISESRLGGARVSLIW